MKRFNLSLIVLLGVLAVPTGEARSAEKEPRPTRPGVSPRPSVPVPPTPRKGCLSAHVTPRAVDFLNLDLKEYGWIFYDAQSDVCAASAYRGLVRKVEGTLQMASREDRGWPRLLPFQGWLEGVHVELIHVSALVLGGRGRLTPRLDSLVRRVQEQYRYTVDPTCDPLSTVNTCFDDQAQAAAAWAWMGAYESLAGRKQSSLSYYERAEAVLRESFAPSNFLCLQQGSAALPLPCETLTSPAEALDSRRSRVVVFNHGFEDAGYGVGLVTSFSSALLAFEVGGRTFTLTPIEKAVLRSIFEEGRRGALPDGSDFRGDGCYEVVGDRLNMGHACADLGYKPKMFPVRLFYDRYVGLANELPYRFDLFDGSLFSADDPFLHLGRKAIYGALAYTWWNPPGAAPLRPPLSATVR